MKLSKFKIVIISLSFATVFSLKPMEKKESLDNEIFASILSTMYGQFLARQETMQTVAVLTSFLNTTEKILEESTEENKKYFKKHNESLKNVVKKIDNDPHYLLVYKVLPNFVSGCAHYVNCLKSISSPQAIPENYFTDLYGSLGQLTCISERIKAINGDLKENHRDLSTNPSSKPLNVDDFDEGSVRVAYTLAVNLVVKEDLKQIFRIRQNIIESFFSGDPKSLKKIQKKEHKLKLLEKLLKNLKHSSLRATYITLPNFEQSFKPILCLASDQDKKNMGMYFHNLDIMHAELTYHFKKLYLK